MTSHQAEIDLLVQAQAGEKEMAQERSLEVLANAKTSGTREGFITGPWELVEGSDEGNATITPPMDSPNDLEPWWTAVIICTDRDVQNRVGRLMVSAPDLLAALKTAREWGPYEADVPDIFPLEMREQEIARIRIVEAAIAQAESQS